MDEEIGEFGRRLMPKELRGFLVKTGKSRYATRDGLYEAWAENESSTRWAWWDTRIKIKRQVPTRLRASVAIYELYKPSDVPKPKCVEAELFDAEGPVVKTKVPTVHGDPTLIEVAIVYANGKQVVLGAFSNGSTQVLWEK